MRVIFQLHSITYCWVSCVGCSSSAMYLTLFMWVPRVRCWSRCRRRGVWRCRGATAPTSWRGSSTTTCVTADTTTSSRPKAATPCPSRRPSRCPSRRPSRHPSRCPSRRPSVCCTACGTTPCWSMCRRASWRDSPVKMCVWRSLKTPTTNSHGRPISLWCATRSTRFSKNYDTSPCLYLQHCYNQDIYTRSNTKELWYLSIIVVNNYLRWILSYVISYNADCTQKIIWLSFMYHFPDVQLYYSIINYYLFVCTIQLCFPSSFYFCSSLVIIVYAQVL